MAPLPPAPVTTRRGNDRFQRLVRHLMISSPRPLQGGYRLATHAIAAIFAALYMYMAGFGVFSPEATARSSLVSR